MRYPVLFSRLSAPVATRGKSRLPLLMRLCAQTDRRPRQAKPVPTSCREPRPAEEERSLRRGRKRRMATPKPIIAKVLKTLRVPPGMVYALVADLEQNLWVVESCPAGTRFWTLAQAADLSQGPRTHRALQEILTLGRAAQLRKQTEIGVQKSLRTAVPLHVHREATAETVTARRHRVEHVRALTPVRSLVEA